MSGGRFVCLVYWEWLSCSLLSEDKSAWIDEGEDTQEVKQVWLKRIFL